MAGRNFTDEERYMAAEALEFLNKLGIVKDAQKNETTIGALATHLHQQIEAYGMVLAKKDLADLLGLSGISSFELSALASVAEIASVPKEAAWAATLATAQEACGKIRAAEKKAKK